MINHNDKDLFFLAIFALYKEFNKKDIFNKFLNNTKRYYSHDGEKIFDFNRSGYANLIKKDKSSLELFDFPSSNYITITKKSENKFLITNNSTNSSRLICV